MGVEYGVLLEYHSYKMGILTGKVKRRLKKLPASGNFDDRRFKNLWQELGHYQAEGPFDALEPAAEETFLHLCQLEIELLPNIEKQLLWFGTARADAANFDELDEVPIDVGALAQSLWAIMRQEAENDEQARRSDKEW